MINKKSTNFIVYYPTNKNSFPEYDISEKSDQMSLSTNIVNKKTVYIIHKGKNKFSTG